MRRSALGVLALLTAVPAGLVAGAAPATAATVSVPSVAGFVADDLHQRVFVGNRDAGKVLAADYSGNLVDSASGISEVSDLALSADGEVLYAASWGTHEIVALDPATLDEITRYTAATTYGPSSLAFAGGKLWFSYGDQWDGNLGSIDPGTGTVTMDQYPDRLWGQALLDGSASKPDLLAVGQTGISTDSMAVLDASGTTPSEVAFYQGDYTLNHGIADIDLVPGAAQVLVNGRERQAYAAGAFSASGAYPSGHRADLSASGLVATADDDQVRVFRPNAPVPLNTITGGAAALAWAGDESKLFVLKGSKQLTLGVIEAPTVSTPTLTVIAPASAPRAKQLTISGTLTSADPFDSGVSLDVLRKDVEHPGGTALPDVAVAPDGTWSLHDTPPAGGPVTYVVSYAGDADHQPVTASAKVSVSRNTPTLTLEPAATTYAYGKKVTFTAHLGATYQNRELELWADPAGSDKPRILVKHGAVNAKGDLSWTVALRRNTVVSAVYAGDARTAPRKVSATANARVGIRVAVARHYKTARVGSQKYFWFHKRTAPVVTTAMSPYAGRSVRMDFQVLVDGRWRSAGYEYFGLSSRGRVAVKIAPPNRAGIKARVRSSYVKRGSGDSVNTTTYGTWTHLYWTA